MKKFLKLISFTLAMTVVLMSFAACGLVEDTADVEKARITRETVLTIGDDIEVNGAYYGYYFSTVYNEQLQEISEAMSDSAAVSSGEVPDVDLKKIKSETESRIIAAKMAYTKAIEEGIELTKEDNSNISSIIDQITASVTQQGMTYTAFCTAMETTPEGIEQVISEEYIGNLYYAKLVSDNFVSAKHILVEAADEASKPEALTKIKEIKAQIDSGEDFDKLMKEHSTDPGLETQPNGYTFTKGQMVEPFENASFALEVGGVSDIVETDYGYHIIKRIETSLSGIATALIETADAEIKAAIDAEKEKLTEGVKATETKKISYYNGLIS